MSRLGRLTVSVFCMAAGFGNTRAESVDFVRDVRPILQRHCHRCHGEAAEKSGLRLDVKAAAFRGGDGYGPAIVVGKAADSPLIQLVTSTDRSERMPPEGDGLSAAEIATLRKWIDAGAAWPDGIDTAKLVDKRDHWSFKPLAVAPGDHSIDSFVDAGLAKEALTPAPEADRRTLVRRLFLVLHGLPPTPEQVDDFLADPDPAAYERLVDDVLASPRYGERMAQHWLDTIGWGETHGFEINTVRKTAWPYRDYVIEAFNADKPYDRFILEQLAGDTVGENRATAFLLAKPMLLPAQIGKDKESIDRARQDELNDMATTTAGAFLGMTLGCARCHDHKFDPISQTDYYAIQAVFAGVKNAERPIHDGDADDKPALVYSGSFATAEPIRKLGRGDVLQPREPVPPGGIRDLGPSLSLADATPERDRRVALARWLADPQHPLTARVVVNRLWQWVFGEGIVGTPSDFGRQGSRPSHPELLDWLAADFLAHGGSTKHTIRMLLLSKAFRRDSRPLSRALTIDSDNHLLWRYAPRRLDAEAIHDQMLWLAGTLDLTMGGPGYSGFKPEGGGVAVYEPKQSWGRPDWRRMIYMTRIRVAKDAVFGVFDCPDFVQDQPRRLRSTTALQSLSLLNSPFVVEQATFLAERIARESSGSPADQVRRLFRLAFQRPPTEDESLACVALAAEHGMPAVCRMLLNTNELLFIH
ncbi:MAG: PSD1 and planctomycete cytochrome C domain-containing protein [Pirellulales bacterium]